jgi:hypothetical protein
MMSISNLQATAITNPSHLPALIIIATLRFETASFPNGKRGQGLSSEPAFAGSSDGTRGRDDEMEASSAPALLLGVPDDQRELSFSRNRVSCWCF